MNKRGNISAKHCFPESFPICTHMLLLHTNRETLLQKHFTQCICNSASSFAGAFSHKQVSSIFLREIQLLAQTEMPVLMMDFHAKWNIPRKHMLLEGTVFKWRGTHLMRSRVPKIVSILIYLWKANVHT